MSRVITFRAWLKPERKMYPVAGMLADIVMLATGENSLTSIGISEIDLMQSTGVKDIHGKDIWEGDVVRWEGGGMVCVRPVVWDVKQAMFLPNSMSGEVEVIGNVYEYRDTAQPVHEEEQAE